MRKRLNAVLVLAALACWNMPLTLAMPSGSHPPPSQAKAQDHSCCPRIHVQLAAPLFVIPPSEMPCRDLPCCAKQRPENPPALTSAPRMERPKVQIAFNRRGQQLAPVDSTTVPQDSGTRFLASYFVRSTVLRI